MSKWNEEEYINEHVEDEEESGVTGLISDFDEYEDYEDIESDEVESEDDGESAVVGLINDLDENEVPVAELEEVVDGEDSVDSDDGLHWSIGVDADEDEDEESELEGSFDGDVSVHGVDVLDGFEPVDEQDTDDLDTLTDAVDDVDYDDVSQTVAQEDLPVDDELIPSEMENGSLEVENNVTDVEEPDGSQNVVEESDEPDVEPQVSELKKKAEGLKRELENSPAITLDFAMINAEGEYIPTRKPDGMMSLKFLNIEKEIKTTKRIRHDDSGLTNLEEQIRMFGQLSPVIVTPFGDYYLLVSGHRRLQALVNLGYEKVLAFIDETIPVELVRYYEAVLNSRKPYNFAEMVEYGQFFKETQSSVGYDLIDNILGLKSGEFLKALYIDSMKADFPDIYTQVLKGKMSIEQASKKIDKEIEKAEKEATSGVDDLNSGALDDKLRNKNELLDMQATAQQQELGKRKILDANTRRAVEQRDGGFCQCCEFGKDEPDFMGAFNVHHIVPVQYGGSDAKSNLILLCSNCHKLVHDYEKGSFLPEKTTYDKYDSVKKIVVLGNMLMILRKRSFAELKRKHIEIFRQVDAGKITLGQGLQKAEVYVGGEEYFNGSPYQTFVDSVADLEYGGLVEGELGNLGMIEDAVVE